MPDAPLDGHLPGPAVGPHVEADDGGVGGHRQLHVVLGDPAHAPVDEAQLHVGALELAQAVGDRLQRALHVALRMRLSVAASPRWICSKRSSSLAPGAVGDGACPATR